MAARDAEFASAKAGWFIPTLFARVMIAFRTSVRFEQYKRIYGYHTRSELLIKRTSSLSLLNQF